LTQGEPDASIHGFMRVSLHPSVEDRVLIGLAWFSGVNAAEENPEWTGMEQLATTLRRVHGTRKPSEIPGLDPARRLYRSFGVDPTKTRPSSEALLRRVLQGKELYRINRLVDAINWASLALVVADADGPCGSPTADSLRTSVSSGTTRAVAVVFAPAGFPELQLREGVVRLASQVGAWCGGELEGDHVVGGASGGERREQGSVGS
jgi:DNA/RNA-binding domain of Phe-tRNA-synthetase-like protein